MASGQAQTQLTHGGECCCLQVFDCLPAAALVGGKIFCVHGGLSPKLKRPEDVNSIQRPTRISKTGDDLLTDIVWSDPNPNIEGKRFREA